MSFTTGICPNFYTLRYITGTAPKWNCMLTTYVTNTNTCYTGYSGPLNNVCSITCDNITWTTSGPNTTCSVPVCAASLNCSICAIPGVCNSCKPGHTLTNGTCP